MMRKLVFLSAVGLLLAMLSPVQAQDGKVLFEFWFGGITDQVETLLADGRYPYGPDLTEYMDSFTADKPDKDNYGGRGRAYLTPPETGDYTIWVWSDDDSLVYLSKDEDPANAELVASVAGWTGANEWTKYTTQKSTPKALEAGKRYYIEGIYADGTGGGNIGVGWSGPGIGNEPNIIAGQYLSAFVVTRHPAYLPLPANGTVDLDVTSQLFQWTPGVGAVAHDVYFGTDPNFGLATAKGRVTFALHYAMEPLTPGAQYFWRVDEVAADGTVSTGDVWTFTVRPLTAHFPNPYDGALWLQPNLVASWAAAQNGVSYTVYGAPIKDAVVAGLDAAKLGVTEETSFDANGLLDPATTYYWRVDTTDADGAVHPGAVWTFSTCDPKGGALAQIWDNRNLAGDPKVVKMVPTIDFNWGEGQPDPNIPVDNFSVRFVAELNVPFTGKYTIYEASDDGARTFLNGKQIAAGWVDRGTTEDASAELDLVAGERYQLIMEYYENGGGAAAYLRWSGPGIPKSIIPQGALMPPQMAFGLTPADGAVDVDSRALLSWSAGDKAVAYSVYLGKNKALVAASDPTVLVATQPQNTFAAAEPFARGTTLYWKVDVITADGTTIPGLVSSFRIIDDNTANWVVGVSAAEPNYLATFVQNGTYDIGTFGGDQTYEFVVRSNPAETQVSMCLIGRMNFGDTKMGLKYEQWNNTKKYGATAFGVMDYTYDVNTAPGEYTHLAFVAKKDAATTELYVNGELKGSVPVFISLSGKVGIGRAIRENGTFVDDFDGDIFGLAIFGKALTPEEIAKHSNMYFNPIAITDPNLLLYYDFEAGAGRTAVDQSGHGNHGVLQGSAKWAQGIFGGCLSLDLATLDSVQADPLNIVTNTVSVMGWVKHDQTPAGWSGIFTHRGTSPGCLGLQQNGLEGPNGPELKYMWGADQYWDFTTGLVVPNGEWYFAALTIAPDRAKFYLNGVDQTATNVAEHVPTNFDAVIRIGRDQDNARVMTCLIDEVKFYNRTLSDVDIQRMLLADVTGPGDVVQGVPNDGITTGGGNNGWPAKELPEYMIDDNTGTKFLHFKGEVEPTGIQVTPAVGATIVTGLTLTTANDAPERDPVKFELSGSNESINGPWTVIASGDVNDFAQATAWPRFTTNAKAISFQNAVAYKHYQVMFPAVRTPASANSMQIAEIELLGVLAPLFTEGFESYAAGSQMHGQGGWKGWDNAAGATAPVTSAQAASGANAVEIIGSSDLVHEFTVAGGVHEFSAMQFIPTGATGTTMFILMNTYKDGGPDDWSDQTEFRMDTGIAYFASGQEAPLVRDKWVEVKYVIDLDNNTVDRWYNGNYVGTGQWDDNVHGTFQAVDLFGNNAASVYYDDIVLR